MRGRAPAYTHTPLSDCVCVPVRAGACVRARARRPPCVLGAPCSIVSACLPVGSFALAAPEASGYYNVMRAHRAATANHRIRHSMYIHIHILHTESERYTRAVRHIRRRKSTTCARVAPRNAAASRRAVDADGDGAPPCEELQIVYSVGERDGGRRGGGGEMRRLSLSLSRIFDEKFTRAPRRAMAPRLFGARSLLECLRTQQ